MKRGSWFSPARIATPLVSLCLVGTATAQKALQEAEPGPSVVGTSRALTLTPDLTDSFESNGRLLWSDMLRVDGASFLKAHFVNVNLRRGDVLVLRSASGRVVEQIEGRGLKDLGSFWALSAYGGELLLEFTFSKPYDYLPFRIDQVVVGDSSIFDPPQEPESICSPAQFEDVLCYQSDAGKWSNILASVGVMSVGGNPVSALYCSGSNVSPMNYVLTNDHCLGSQAECDSTEFVFKFYRTACNTGAPPTVDWEGFHCDTLVASSPLGSCDQTLADLDFALSSVVGDPASTYGFATPDPTPLTDGEGIYIVQHPNGRPHEIAHGSGANVDVDGTVLRYYDTLDTEGGSSGSPIYRESDDKLVGLHHCGGCSTPGTGNRGMLMSDIYPSIEPFLCTPDVSLTSAGSQGLAEVQGNGDAVLDPGETWSFTPRLRNGSCSLQVTGATATVQVNAMSIACQVLNPSAVFGDIAAGASVPAQQPVRFRVGLGAGCGGSVLLDLVDLEATNGGPFQDAPGFFAMPVGDEPLTSLYFDDFSGGQGTWTIVNGGTGSGAASTWTTANPGGRSLPLSAPFFIADSDALGTGQVMDEVLTSAPFSVVGFAQVQLQFTHDFNWYSGGLNEMGLVLVRSSATFGSWRQVLAFSGADASGTVNVDITRHAAGASDLEIRFHYTNAQFEWWWAIDDVTVIGSNGMECHPFDPVVRPRSAVQRP